MRGSSLRYGVSSLGVGAYGVYCGQAPPLVDICVHHSTPPETFWRNGSNRVRQKIRVQSAPYHILARSQRTMSSDSADEVRPDAKINHEDSIKYWEANSPDLNGMLGSHSKVSRVDLRGSRTFITKLRRLSSDHQVRNAPKLELGVDCGAGIGRVTEGCLSNVCKVVDVVEPVEKFAKVLSEGPLKMEGKVGEVYIQGLQDWEPTKSYDLIWNQWCVGHLTDSQLTAYLVRCGKAIKKAGWIVVKENLSTHQYGEDIFDDVDSSVTRSDQKFRDLFEQSGLHIVKAELQTGFPKNPRLYPVKMYALRPK